MAKEGKTNFGDFYDYEKSKQIIEKTEKDLHELLQVFGEVSRTLDSFRKTYTKSLDSTKKAMLSNNQALKKLHKTQKESVNIILKTTKENEKLAKSGKDLDSTIKGVDEATKKLGNSVNDQKKRLSLLRQEFESLDPEIAKDKKRLQELSTQLIKTDQAIKAMSKATRDSNNVLTRVQGSYNSLTAAIKKDLDALKNIEGATNKSSAAYRRNRKEIEALQARIRSNTSSLKKFDNEIGRNFREVGNYSTAFRGAAGAARQFAGALGFTGVIFGLVGAFKQAFTTIRNFQKQNATLAGVLNTTRDNTKELTQDALRLGSTTAKTASEVTELQIAYSRLGFKQQDIIDLTGDTINGSIALNAGLAETAELTGAVVKTFNDLETTDADIILDQLTSATQNSALTFEKLQTTIPIVAGAANAAGIPFTKLLSLLGKLSDAGIDASSSATSLRNIFIESASEGLNYNQILDKIRNSQDQLTAANNAFGKRASVSATILSNLSDEVVSLDEKLQNAAGTAARVAQTELDTLDGSIKLLTSSYEGLILAVEDGDGVIGTFTKSVVDGLTDYLTIIKEAENGTIGWTDVLLSALDPLGAQNALIKAQVEQFKEVNKQQSILTQAQHLYNEAIEHGIDTYEDYVNRLSSAISGNSNKTEILAQMQVLYNGVIEEQKEIEEEQERNRQISQTKQEKRQKDQLEYFTKFSKVVQDGGKEARKGIEPLEAALDVNIPEALDKVEEKTQSTVSKMKLYWKTFSQEIKLAISTAFNVASISANQFFINSQINRENDFAIFEENQNKEIEKLEEKRDRELELSGRSAESKEAINKRYNDQIQKLEQETADKQKQLRRDSAKAEKAESIFSAIINTAQGVTAALATANIPLAISIGIIGTAKTLAIASQPLPKFAEGTDSSPDGTIMVNDGKRGNKVNRELITTPQGKSFFFDTDSPVVTNMIPKGSKIDPRDISELTNLSDRIQDYSPVAGQHNKMMRSFEEKVTEHKKYITINNKNEINYDLLGQAVARNLPPQYLFEFADDGKLKKSIIKGNTKRIVGEKDILKNSNLAKQIKKLTK